MAFKGQRNYQKSFGLSVHLGNNALRRLHGELQGRRNRERAGGAGLNRPLHILADQLALFQPGGRLCPQHYYYPLELSDLPSAPSSCRRSVLLPIFRVFAFIKEQQQRCLLRQFLTNTLGYSV